MTGEALWPCSRSVDRKVSPPFGCIVDNLHVLLWNRYVPKCVLNTHWPEHLDSLTQYIDLEAAGSKLREPLDNGDLVAELGEPKKKNQSITCDPCSADEHFQGHFLIRL
jgi:hypothetical protein